MGTENSLAKLGGKKAVSKLRLGKRAISCSKGTPKTMKM